MRKRNLPLYWPYNHCYGESATFARKGDSYVTHPHKPSGAGSSNRKTSKVKKKKDERVGITGNEEEMGTVYNYRMNGKRSFHWGSFSQPSFPQSMGFLNR